MVMMVVVSFVLHRMNKYHEMRKQVTHSEGLDRFFFEDVRMAAIVFELDEGRSEADVLAAVRTQLSDVQPVYLGRRLAQPYNSTQMPADVAWSGVIVIKLLPSFDPNTSGIYTVLSSVTRQVVVVHFNVDFFTNAIVVPIGTFVSYVYERYVLGFTDFIAPMPISTEAERTNADKKEKFLSEIDRNHRKDDSSAGAILMLNFIKNWDAVAESENYQRDQRYQMKMLAMFGGSSSGPVYIGKYTKSNQMAMNFDVVALVYYPGRKFFSDMIRSHFIDRVAIDKTLADTFVMCTAPLRM